MEPVNRNEIMSKLKEQLANSPTIARSRADPLSKVISVDNPLEPEKGGFLKAYKEHYKPAYGSNSRVFNDETGKLDPLPYNMGLKDEMPKLSLESGKLFSSSIKDLQGYGNESEFRAISINTAKELGLDLKEANSLLKNVAENITKSTDSMLFPNLYGTIDEESIKGYEASNKFDRSLYQSILNNSDLSQGFYFKASLSNGYLVSLNNIKDQDIIQAFDNAAKACAPKISFDDAKYEPQFKKLEQCLKQLNIFINHCHQNECDHLQEVFDISNKGLSLRYREYGYTSGKDIYMLEPWNNMPKSPFASLSNYNENGNLPYINFPKPSNFKSENDYLRAGAHVITNALINKALDNYNKGIDNPFKFTRNDAALLKGSTDPYFIYNGSISNREQRDVENKSFAFLTRDIAGTMFAAQFGVPVTQNDINRFNVYFQDSNFPEQKANRIFNVASRVANYAASMELSKMANTRVVSDNPNLWANWKADNEQYAIQMATPSLNEICKQNNAAINKNNVIKALNELTSQKVNEIAKNKEPIKAALSQDHPINKELLNQNINSQSVDKSKGSKNKGLER